MLASPLKAMLLLAEGNLACLPPEGVLARLPLEGVLALLLTEGVMTLTSLTQGSWSSCTTTSSSGSVSSPSWSTWSSALTKRMKEPTPLLGPATIGPLPLLCLSDGTISENKNKHLKIILKLFLKYDEMLTINHTHLLTSIWGGTPY